MKIKVDVTKLQKEYHSLTGQLISLDYKNQMELEEYVEVFEDIENRLKEIEQELLFYGYAIDKHHILHIIGD